MNKWISLVVLFTLCQITYGQSSKIVLGNTDIGVNEVFTISITLENEEVENYSGFPDITDMLKRGTSSSASTNIINGQMSFTQSIIQNYIPTKEGKFVIKPFTMKVNGKAIFCPGATIHVGPPVQRKRSSTFFDTDVDDFFGNTREPTEFVDVKDKAFLAVSTSKNEIYVGEGVTTALSFYVAEDNEAEMQFYDLQNQLMALVKKIKPGHCWEENFMIQQVEGQPVDINGKRYMQYKLYEATFYPLTAKDISFPSLDLKLIKYKVAKNPSFFGNNRQEDFKIFKSAYKKVKVKELPPHPLRDKVAVGVFELREDLRPIKVEAGKGFTYVFKIIGEGNISSISAPDILTTEKITIYPPSIHQTINRLMGRVVGDKTFTYYGTPLDTGIYQLKDYLQFTFFNPKTGKYESLRPAQSLRVIGVPITFMGNPNQDEFTKEYGLLSSPKEKWVNRQSLDWWKISSFIFLALMILGVMYMVLKK